MDNTVIFEASETFSVPTAVADKHLQASPVQLRLILFLLRNANKSFTKNDLLTAVGASEAETDEAFEYWCRAGILFKAKGKYMFERPKLAASDIMKYTPSQIAERTKTDGSMKFLYSTAERIFAKTISDTEASLIFSLVDWNGIDAEAVALLLQYGKDLGLPLSKIQKIGIEWMESEITTAEKAEGYIEEQKERRSTENRIAQMLGIGHRALTDGERKAFLSWVTELSFSFDMIKLAYDKTVRNTGKYTYTYMDKILRSWYEKGYKTAFDVEEKETNTEKAPKTRKKGTYSKKSVTNASESMQDSWNIILNDLEEDEK